MKKKNTVKVSHNEDRSKDDPRLYSIQFYEDGKEIARMVLLDKEVNEFLDREAHGGRSLFNDLTRIIGINCWGIDIIQPDHPLYSEIIAETKSARVYHIRCDTVKLLKAITNRTLARGKVESEFELDLNKFILRPESIDRPLSIVQVLRLATKGDAFNFKRLVQSVLAFRRSLSQKAWDTFVEMICLYALQRGAELYGRDEVEINFKSCGIFGGFILRDDDFSIHT